MNWTALNEQERKLVLSWRPIEAIKSLRARLNCGLKEAKDACDEYRNVMAQYKVSECSHVSNFIRVKSANEDAVVCTLCGAMYRRV